LSQSEDRCRNTDSDDEELEEPIGGVAIGHSRMPPLPPLARAYNGAPSLRAGMQSSSRKETHSPLGQRVSGEEDSSFTGASHATLAYIQLEEYNVDPKELTELHDTHKDAISRIVRNQVFSRVKFLNKSGKEHEKVFGSFWKPDLLVNTPQYVDVILNNFPDLKRRKKDELQLTDAVHFWMKASTVVRQVILDRRSNVTQRLKREVVIGTYKS
jgi:hypothetical protein